MELKEKYQNRRASFFSTDALIALMIIIFVIFMAKPLINYVQPDTDINSDVLQALSTLKVSELDDATVKAMIANGEIREPSKSLLEQIGEFYVYNLSRARLLTEIALEELSTTENVGIWYGDPTHGYDLIFSNNRTPYESAREVDVARKIVSGIAAGENITGFSARASLSSDYRTNYFYFGGYVGDGNVSILIDYQGNITDEAEMELVINSSSGSFDFYVNGVYMGAYANSPSPYQPVRHVFNTSSFSPGFNLLEFKGKKLYFAGGFVKIAYRGEVQFGNKNNTYYFPGIDGLINIYDGFFVPQNLSSMEIKLNMKSNYTILLNIGNISVYNSSTGGVAQNITLSDAYLSTILNYSELSGRTIPLRLGLENASYLGITQKIDVFSVTDLSGSMDDNCGSCNELTCTPYGTCNDANGCGICDAKGANSLLVSYILNNSGNRVGLVGYESIANISDFHSLSNDSSSLNSEISEWDADGNTCICCGINRAIAGFANESNKGFRGGLITYYDFDNAMIGSAVEDRSGEGNNGTLVGSAAIITGAEQNAMNFSASGTNYISMPDLVNSEEGTISFWIKPSRDDRVTIFDASSPNYYLFADIDGSENLRFRFEDSSDADFNDALYNVHDIHLGGWRHVAAVWRFGGAIPSAELYLDGVLVDSDVNSAGEIADFLTPRIGETRSNYVTTWDLEGAIDEFRFYSRPLESFEINALNDTTPVCGNGLVEMGEVCDDNLDWCNFNGQNGTKSCNPSCTGYLSCSAGVCGDGIINEGEQCDDSNSVDEDSCNNECQIWSRYRSMVVMSDGQANVQCSQQGTGSSANDAILASQQACEDYGVVVHAVGFGTGIDEATLTSIANNDCGGQYFYSSATNLTEVYRQIAQIITTEYVEQTLSTGGANVNTRLYPDSYIRFNYTEPEYPYGLIITAESLFDDARGGSFYIPNGAKPLMTNVISYSGAKWTSDVLVNGNDIFNLDSYGLKYIFLGDPYKISTTDAGVIEGINYANVSTAVSSINKSEGSEFDKIIFTIAKNASSYSKIVALASGCVWQVEMEDGSYVNNLRIPNLYAGSDVCSYNSSSFVASSPPGDFGIISNQDDAYQVAVLNLLRELDLDEDGKSDVVFSAQDLAINLDEFSGIPFAYYTEVEVRRWA